MKLLACLRYYFIWQSTLAWVAIIGTSLIGIGVLLRASPLGPSLAALGALFGLGFPIIVGCIAFRRLIGNPHLIMAPGVRVPATGALMALAAIGASGATLVLLMAPEASRGLEPHHFWALAFGWLSLYLLLSQWLVTHFFGLFSFAIVPLIVLRLAASVEETLRSALVDWRIALAVAVAGWAWLFLAARRKGIPRGVANPARSNSRFAQAWARVGFGDRSSPRQAFWLPRGGYPATAEGSLVRGTFDGLRNRIVMALQAVLLFPVSLMILFALIGVPFDDSERPAVLAGFYALLSFYGICMFASMVYAEWPVRLRLVWLRVGGDRKRFWRRLEGMLLGDLGLITVIAAMTGIGFRLGFGLSADLVLLYVAGSFVAGLFCAYLGCWIRVLGRGALLQSLLLIVIIVASLIALTYLRSRGSPGAIFYLLPTFLLLSLSLRAIVRRRFLRMDWCKIRPARLHRPLWTGA